MIVMNKIKYEFELCMNESYNEYDNIDEWGCAFLYTNVHRGVEYNFCRQSGGDYSAIYWFNIDEYLNTDYDRFISYTIDFENKNWEQELKNKMIEVYEYFEKRGA